jgi:7-cyano-7-deazaguanine synthase in queuosine biosynthesis
MSKMGRVLVAMSGGIDSTVAAMNLGLCQQWWIQKRNRLLQSGFYQ